LTFTLTLEVKPHCPALDSGQWVADSPTPTPSPVGEWGGFDRELDDISFDTMLSRKGYQLSPDRLAALKELHRVVLTTALLQLRNIRDALQER